MKPTPNHLAIGLIVLLLAAVTTASRLAELKLSGESYQPTIEPKHRFCVGVEHPETGLGLVCSEGPKQIIPEAVRLLGVPETCLKVTLPQSLHPGDLVVLNRHHDGCSRGRIEQLPAALRLLSGQGLNINRASVDELKLLPAIGEIKARRIVESRKIAGPFADPYNLTRVHGIGTKTVDRLKP